jgi:hypothetical protein
MLSLDAIYMVDLLEIIGVGVIWLCEFVKFKQVDYIVV